MRITTLKHPSRRDVVAGGFAMLVLANLDRAVVLAQVAARRQGPLVDFFKQLGRDYCKLADEGPEKPKRRLRVIQGGGN